MVRWADTERQAGPGSCGVPFCTAQSCLDGSSSAFLLRQCICELRVPTCRGTQDWDFEAGGAGKMFLYASLCETRDLLHACARVYVRTSFLQNI